MAAVLDATDAESELEPGKIVVPVRPRKGGRVFLVVAAVVVLAGATIYYRSWRNRLQELPHVAEVNAAEGKTALESGRFDDAKAKLRRAADAYIELKSSDEAAIEAIRLADEAAILADLGLTPLSEILDEVARLGETDGMEKFKSRYRGQSILLDTEIESVDPKVELAYRVFVGRGPVPAKVGRLDLADFELLSGRDFKPNEGVIFGARLDSIRIEGKEWRITLQPRSGVWMTNSKALAIGFGEVPPS